MPARSTLGSDLLVGAAAGAVASAVTAGADRLLDPLVSDAARRRERAVREGPGHDVAAGAFARRLAGPGADARALRRGRALFGLLFGVGWGLVYAAVRRRQPAAARAAGLPFAVPFFLACDGAIAPLTGLSPSPRALPWQVNAKELANHAVWTAAAEVVTRAVRGRV